MLTDQAYHLLISVALRGEGATRRLTYSLSDVILRTDLGNDPLGEWTKRNPGRYAIWLQWSPLAGIQPGGETEGAGEMAMSARKTDRLGGALEAEILRGVEIAMRIEQGYYGEGESRINFAPKEVDGGAQE